MLHIFKMLESTQKTSKNKTRTSLALFKVEKGKWYRFRLVNSMSLVCPAELTIEKHTLNVIGSDSFNLQPIIGTSIVSLAGERYDFVVSANQSEGEMNVLLRVDVILEKKNHGTLSFYSRHTFWIRVRGLGSCAGHEVQQFAVFSYNKRENKVKLSFPSKPDIVYSNMTFANDTVSQRFDHKLKIILHFILIVAEPPQ